MKLSEQVDAASPWPSQYQEIANGLIDKWDRASQHRYRKDA